MHATPNPQMCVHPDRGHISALETSSCQDVSIQMGTYLCPQNALPAKMCPRTINSVQPPHQQVLVFSLSATLGVIRVPIVDQQLGQIGPLQRILVLQVYPQLFILR